MVGEKEMREVKTAAKDLRDNCGQGKGSLMYILVDISDMLVI